METGKMTQTKAGPSTAQAVQIPAAKQFEKIQLLYNKIMSFFCDDF